MLASEDMETCCRLLLMAVQCINALICHLCNNNIYHNLPLVIPARCNESPPAPLLLHNMQNHRQAIMGLGRILSGGGGGGAFQGFSLTGESAEFPGTLVSGSVNLRGSAPDLFRTLCKIRRGSAGYRGGFGAPTADAPTREATTT